MWIRPTDIRSNILRINKLSVEHKFCMFRSFLASLTRSFLLAVNVSHMSTSTFLTTLLICKVLSLF